MIASIGQASNVAPTAEQMRNEGCLALHRKARMRQVAHHDGSGLWVRTGSSVQVPSSMPDAFYFKQSEGLR